eukprot:TRINITY_DN61299_c0_g1_i1.p1 TRINITY_DN61299_c0_g1~~TRINITY_DN61299_c0_g1_i1.p1  ORF type:complete len:622 (-),score=55.69 TRINITY_DN61299_c0_g1_i1:209-2074(-)
MEVSDTPLRFGEHNVVLTVYDAAGATDTCSTTVFVTHGPLIEPRGGGCSGEAGIPLQIATNRIFSSDPGTGPQLALDSNLDTSYSTILGDSETMELWFEFSVGEDAVLCTEALMGVAPVGGLLSVSVISGNHDGNFSAGDFQTLVEDVQVGSDGVVLLPYVFGRVLKVTMKTPQRFFQVAEFLNARLSQLSCRYPEGYNADSSGAFANRIDKNSDIMNLFDGKKKISYDSGKKKTSKKPRVWWLAPVPTLLCTATVLLRDVLPGTKIEARVYNPLVPDKNGVYSTDFIPKKGKLSYYRTFYSTKVKAPKDAADKDAPLATFEFDIPPVYGAALMVAVNKVPTLIGEIAPLLKGTVPPPTVCWPARRNIPTLYLHTLDDRDDSDDMDDFDDVDDFDDYDDADDRPADDDDLDDDDLQVVKKVRRMHVNQVEGEAQVNIWRAGASQVDGFLAEEEQFARASEFYGPLYALDGYPTVYDSGPPITNPVSMWIFWDLPFELCEIRVEFGPFMVLQSVDRQLTLSLFSKDGGGTKFINTGDNTDTPFYDSNTFRIPQQEITFNLVGSSSPSSTNNTVYSVIPVRTSARGIKIEFFGHLVISEVHVHAQTLERDAEQELLDDSQGNA